MTTSAGPNTVTMQTVGNQSRTMTIGLSDSTITSDSASDAGAASSDHNSSSTGEGTIAGIVVASIGEFASIVAAISLILVVRRRSLSNSPESSVQNGLIDGNNNGENPQVGFARGMFSNNDDHSPSAGSSNAACAQTFIDNRMKTDEMLYGNGNRNSNASLQDSEDYVATSTIPSRTNTN